jgi:hypothetical protein
MSNFPMEHDNKDKMTEERAREIVSRESNGIPGTDSYEEEDRAEGYLERVEQESRQGKGICTIHSGQPACLPCAKDFWELRIALEASRDALLAADEIAKGIDAAWDYAVRHPNNQGLGFGHVVDLVKDYRAAREKTK